MPNNTENLLTGSFQERLRKSISFAWLVFMKKVGSSFLPINKEASMQLHYAYILQQVIPLICFDQNEHVQVELESSEHIDDRSREIDLVLKGTDSCGDYKIAVEMKCYRRTASSGKPRFATDLFMKGVYDDLKLLEDYCRLAEYDRGILLVMTDHEYFVNSPKGRRGRGKCWDYDISDDHQVEDIHLKTPIGGKKVDIKLRKLYKFKWHQCGGFWFMENEGY